MSDQDAFERILASLYDAMLDDVHWPSTSALIDEACGSTGKCPTAIWCVSKGIVKLTHHRLRQPKDIVSKATSEY